MADSEFQDILNEAVKAEYNTLFMLPRHLALIDDEEGKTLTIELEMAAGSATLICK